MTEYYKKDAVDKLVKDVHDIIQNIIDDATDDFPKGVASRLTKAAAKLQGVLDGSIKVKQVE